MMHPLLFPDILQKAHLKPSPILNELHGLVVADSVNHEVSLVAEWALQCMSINGPSIQHAFPRAKCMVLT